MVTLIILHLLVSVVCFVVHYFWWVSPEERQKEPYVMILGMSIISLIPLVNLALVIHYAWDMYNDHRKPLL